METLDRDTFLEKVAAMKNAYEASPTWATLDRLAQPIVSGPDARAEFLAFLVIFCENVNLRPKRSLRERIRAFLA